MRKDRPSVGDGHPVVCRALVADDAPPAAWDWVGDPEYTRGEGEQGDQRDRVDSAHFALRRVGRFPLHQCGGARFQERERQLGEADSAEDREGDRRVD